MNTASLYICKNYAISLCLLLIVPLKVYLDFGLAIPKLSVHGMVSSVKELLDLAPTKKVKCTMFNIISLYLHKNVLSLLLFMNT